MKKRCGSMILEVSIGLALLVAVSASLSMLTKTLNGGRASLRSLANQRIRVESAGERLAVVSYQELKIAAEEISNEEPVKITLLPFNLEGRLGTQVTLAANDYPGVVLKIWRFSDTQTESDDEE